MADAGIGARRDCEEMITSGRVKVNGRVVTTLPCFVGDLEPRLERAGEEIAALRHFQWIVMNNEDRHRREIRTVIDRMARLLKSHADLFAGKRPTY